VNDRFRQLPAGGWLDVTANYARMHADPAKLIACGVTTRPVETVIAILAAGGERGERRCIRRSLRSVCGRLFTGNP
jgi:hypothetical protein